MNNFESKLIPLAEIIKPHGIKGELKIIFFNEESDTLKIGNDVFLSDSSGKSLECRIENIFYSHKKNRIKFFDINSIDDAEKLRGFFINVPRENLPHLDEGEFYLVDLSNYKIFDEKGNEFGLVLDVLHLPANDVLVVKNSEKEHLIPIIDDVILNISHEDKKIIINPLEGLFN